MRFNDYVENVDVFIRQQANLLAEGFIDGADTYEDALRELKRQRPVGTNKIAYLLYDKTAEYIKQQAFKQSTKWGG